VPGTPGNGCRGLHPPTPLVGVWNRRNTSPTCWGSVFHTPPTEIGLCNLRGIPAGFQAGPRRRPVSETCADSVQVFKPARLHTPPAGNGVCNLLISKLENVLRTVALHPLRRRTASETCFRRRNLRKVCAGCTPLRRTSCRRRTCRTVMTLPNLLGKVWRHIARPEPRRTPARCSAVSSPCAYRLDRTAS
jgi:hypothetical protein